MKTTVILAVLFLSVAAYADSRNPEESTKPIARNQPAAPI